MRLGIWKIPAAAIVAGLKDIDVIRWRGNFGYDRNTRRFVIPMICMARR